MKRYVNFLDHIPSFNELYKNMCFPLHDPTFCSIFYYQFVRKGYGQESTMGFPLS